MDLNLAKTAIASYKHLGRVCQRLDTLVMQRAMSSFGYNKTSARNFSALDTAYDIIELSERKVELVNLKVAIDKTLMSINKKVARLLLKRYLNGEKTITIMNQLHITERSCYRAFNRACEIFLNRIAQFGYTEEKFKELFENHRWINNFYIKYAVKTEEASSLVEFSPSTLGRIMSQYRYAMYI